MIINFVPQRLDISDFLVDVEGDIIYINGEEFDFGPLKEGDVLPAAACSPAFFVGEITRGVNGVELTVSLPHGPNAPRERRFPQPITVIEDGSVDLPPYDEPPPQPELPESPVEEEVANDD